MKETVCYFKQGHCYKFYGKKAVLCRFLDKETKRCKFVVVRKIEKKT